MAHNEQGEVRAIVFVQPERQMIKVIKDEDKTKDDQRIFSHNNSTKICKSTLLYSNTNV